MQQVRPGPTAPGFRRRGARVVTPIWPTAGLSFGGEYNPEQWAPKVWREDVALMRQAGVNLVSVGIFSWGLLEPERGRFDLAWLREVLDLLHDAEIAVVLATPTASPPAWLHQAHPETLPIDANGTHMPQGTRLGEHLRRPAPVRGSTVADVLVALLHDDEAGLGTKVRSEAAQRLAARRPGARPPPRLVDRAVTVDILLPWADLSGHRLVLVPGLYLTSPKTAAAARDSAQVLVTWLSGIVGATNRVLPGGYPGAFADLLGVRAEEFFPLSGDEYRTLDTGWRVGTWTELLGATDAEVLARYADGELADVPALTQRRVGDGAAWCLATSLDRAGVDALAGLLVEAAGLRPVVAAPGVRPVVAAPAGIEAVRRQEPAAPSCSSSPTPMPTRPSTLKVATCSPAPRMPRR